MIFCIKMEFATGIIMHVEEMNIYFYSIIKALECELKHLKAGLVLLFIIDTIIL